MWQLPGDQLAGALELVERIARRLGFGGLRMLAEMHARGVAMQEAGLPTRAFLVERLRITPTEAGGRMRALGELIPGRNVSGEVIPPSLPTTAGGVAAGELSREHASVISQAIRKLPTSLDTATRNAAEVTLGTQARTLDPGQLRKVARRLHEHLDPDGSVEDDKPSRNRLSFHRDLDGGYDDRGIWIRS